MWARGWFAPNFSETPTGHFPCENDTSEWAEIPVDPGRFCFRCTAHHPQPPLKQGSTPTHPSMEGGTGKGAV